MTRHVRGGNEEERGQVLVLFALMITVICGFAALAVDVTNAYADLRFYRSVADAASLAGAQNLQQGGTRTVGATEYQRARASALTTVESELHGTIDPLCGGTAADIVNCSVRGTDYVVSIRTPSPSCASCDPTRAVQVTVSNPTYRLTFARVFAQNQWNVGTTSVAGITFTGKYALVTLRPPDPLPNGVDQNRENINVNGNNTRLNILQGDIGTNTSAYTNSGGFITLADGYLLHHIDDITPDPWNKDLAGNPAGRLIGPELIDDPNYPYASFTGAPRFADQPAGVTPCPTTGDPDWPTGYSTILATAVCYLPGVYERNFNVPTNTDVVYLLPGAYYFEGGLDVRGSLLGGLVAARPGVVLVVPQTQTLTGNNAVRVWLNNGSEGCASDTCRALPAVDFAGTQIKTPGDLIITLEVTRDGTCFTGLTPRREVDGGCTGTGNNTIRLPGNGQLDISGVIYAPSDNLQINGDNSVQTGRVGQIISWTITYSGGAKLNQSYPGNDDVGIMRLDAACTGPSTPCNL